MKRRLPASTCRRAVSSVAAAGAVVALTAACQAFSPTQTDVPYNPADGVPANVGQLAIRDLAIIGEGTGEAMVSGSAINLGAEPMTVQLTPQLAEGATEQPSASEVELGPREQVDLSTKGLQLSGFTAKPGTVMTMRVTSSTSGTTIVTVPVLPAEGYYSTVTPAPTAGILTPQ